jgi:flagellar hook protein FlgE
MSAINQALQGLASAQSQFDTAANQIARFTQTQTAPTPTPAGDTVNLSTAAVNLLQAQNNFEANTKLIKVADQLDQTLLNSI